ncbi:MAG: hypothetical protein RLZ55_826 [Actinomycetota bacterium]
MEAIVLSGAPVYVDHNLPPVEAIGIAGGRIAAAGSLREVSAALPSEARQLRASRAAFMPSFVDAHQHSFLVAVDPNTDVLHGAASTIPEMLLRLGSLVAQSPPTSDRQWLRFHGYTPLDLAERRSPTAAELDSACDDRPRHVLSRTFHESAVNGAGLEALQIGRHTPDPPGGRIMRDRRGRPTGVLLEAASFAAEATSRPKDPEGDWRPRLTAFGRMLLSHGITAIGDAAVPATVASQMVEVLAQAGVAAYPLLTGERIDRPGLVAGATAKVLADGGEYCHLCMTPAQVGRVMRASARASLGPEGAVARALGRRSGMPHREADRRWHTGIRYPAGADFANVLTQAADAGSSVAVHAVGNGAVDAVLAARAADPGRAARVPLRMEHAMVVDPALAARLGAEGIPVVTQPGFLAAYGHELNLVPVPTPLRLLPLRTLADAGVPLAFGSDYPAADLSPWQSVASAVHRRDRTGTRIHPDEELSIRQALIAHTSTAADVVGDAAAGRLAPGSPATMIWCDADPYTANDAAALAGITTLATWVTGELRHGSAPPLAAGSAADA